MLAFTCPRCRQETAAETYGPCPECRADLNGDATAIGNRVKRDHEERVEAQRVADEQEMAEFIARQQADAAKRRRGRRAA